MYLGVPNMRTKPHSGRYARLSQPTASSTATADGECWLYTVASRHGTRSGPWLPDYDDEHILSPRYVDDSVVGDGHDMERTSPVRYRVSKPQSTEGVSVAAG